MPAKPNEDEIRSREIPEIQSEKTSNYMYTDEEGIDNGIASTSEGGAASTIAPYAVAVIVALILFLIMSTSYINDFVNKTFNERAMLVKIFASLATSCIFTYAWHALTKKN